MYYPPKAIAFIWKVVMNRIYSTHSILVSVVIKMCDIYKFKSLSNSILWLGKNVHCWCLLPRPNHVYLYNDY